MTRIRKAVFPVAGQGTRFLPATKAVPKEMLPLVDRPLIDYAVEEACAAGIEEFIFVTSAGKSALENHFDSAPALETVLASKGKTAELAMLRRCRIPDGNLSFVRQSEPLGLGHAVWCARRHVGDEPFAVVLPDDVVASRQPCLQQMVETHARTGGNMIATMEVEQDQISAYGCLDALHADGALHRARGIVEKPAPDRAPSNLAVIGRYILQPSVISALEGLDRGAGGEIQLTDALAADLATTPLWGYRFEGERFDCGSKVGFLEATVAFGLAHEQLGDAFACALDRRVNARLRAA